MMGVFKFDQLYKKLKLSSCSSILHLTLIGLLSTMAREKLAMGSESLWIELILMRDENVAILKWELIKSTLTALGLIVCGVVNSTCKYLIINFVRKYAPKGRPINTFTLIDQALQLGLSAIFTIALVGSIMAETAIGDVFGYFGCTILWFVVTLHNCCVTSGAFTMALFRMAAVYLRHSPLSRYLRNKATVKIVVAFEATVITISIIPTWIGKETSGSTLVTQFCYGRSSAMEVILMRYQGVPDETLTFGMIMITTTFMMVQGLVVGELVIYIAMFRYLREHNKSMAATVTREELRRRHKGNVINLTGQAVSCLVSTLTITGMIVMVKIDNNHFFSPASINCFFILAYALNSIAFISASPELRRAYFN